MTDTSGCRDFALGDILTITTGRLVNTRGMDAVYDLLNFMTGDSLFTHQLPRAQEACGPALLVQHPDLTEVVEPTWLAGEEECDRWVAEQVSRLGETRPVAPLAPGAWLHIDPITEMEMIRPDAQVIPVVVPDTPPPTDTDGAMRQTTRGGDRD